MAKRIVILANKTWEVEPLVGAFKSAEARPGDFPDVADTVPQVTVPISDQKMKVVPARLALQRDDTTAEVWCVRDLMDIPAKSSSSSEEKARVLKVLAEAGPKPWLVIAFGTAATADTHSYNGCVVVGSNVFVHDPTSGGNPQSRWVHPDFDKLKDSSQQPVNKALFDVRDGFFSGPLRYALEARFLQPPINPATPPSLLLSAAYVALSNVNVTNWNDYAWADPQGLHALAAAEPKQVVGSVETTHGVIRLMVPSEQFLFVSAIANRLGYFNMETSVRPYAQDFAASHNGGVTLAWMMPTLMPKKP